MSLKTIPLDDQVNIIISNENLNNKLNEENNVSIGFKQDTKLLVASIDNKNWRVYLNSTTSIGNPKYANQLCRFLDTRTSDQTVTLYLGSWTNELNTLSIGSILHSISNCQAKITAIACGYCGVPETMMWVHAPNRSIGKYGALKFSGGEFIKMYPQCQSYISTFLNKGKEIGILNDKDIVNILQRNKEKFVMLQDVINIKENNI